MKATIAIGEEVINEKVAETIDYAVNTIFQYTNNATIIINEDTESMTVEGREPLEKTNIEVTDNTTVMLNQLKPESNTPDHASFMVAEWSVEMWLKYGVTYFYAEYDKEKSELRLFWNKCTDKTQIQSYWIENTTNGWNTKGLFWKREWLKPEHGSKSGTGKTGRR